MSSLVSDQGTSYRVLGQSDSFLGGGHAIPDIWKIFDDLTSPGPVGDSFDAFKSVTSICTLSPRGKVVENALTSREVPEALAEIRAALSLSTVELSKIFNVSRRAIYDWVEGRNVSLSNRKRITDVHAVAKSWSSRELGRLGSLVREQVNEHSVLAALCSGELDMSHIESLLEAIAAKVSQAQKSRRVPTALELSKRHPMASLSEQTYRRNLKVSKPRR
ncbi:MAG: hypothetical protein JJU20_11950 [Opitutales bacterium]|nr:hypothetical protein [Opitutales bacterium]